MKKEHNKKLHETKYKLKDAKQLNVGRLSMLAGS